MRPELDDAAEIHHGDAVADMRDHADVVRHEQQGQPEFALQVVEQVEHLGADRHVERRDRLVGDDDLRRERQRARDAEALALAAGQFVRIAAAMLGVQPDAAPAARGRARGAPRRCRCR